MWDRNDATGTVAQLGARRTEDAEAAGSSPASPTIFSSAVSSVDSVKRLCLNAMQLLDSNRGRIDQ